MLEWLLHSDPSSSDGSSRNNASDTARRESDAETSALVEAIHRSQAVIEFEPDGTIRTANDNFLEVVGYRLKEVEGEHHRIFVEDEYARSEEYRAFWEKLRRGEYHGDRLKRLTKSGEEVWLQATYNPVFGPDGEVQKIVKLAEDVTEQVRTEQKLAEREETLSQRVDTLLDAMQRFADGDLTVRVEADAEGDVRRLFEGFNDAVTTMRGMMAQVAEAISTAGATAEQVSASAEELSAGAEEQSSQTDEVAAAMEEMTRTIADNSESVTETNDLASENRRTARENGQVVLRAADKMEEIGEVVGRSAEQVERLHAASEEIGDIVKTIDEIADQTNLLALNAAIEAARAGGDGSGGQTGQGFAVVAEEVRELAEETDQATDEIADKIEGVQSQTREAVESMETGQEEVEDGIELAREARDAFEEIVEGANMIGDRVDEIASATEEQSTTSEQISQNVESISTVSQQNAKATHDIAQAIGELKDASADARRLVEQFRLGEGQQLGGTHQMEGAQQPGGGSRGVSGYSGGEFSPDENGTAGDGAPVGNGTAEAGAPGAPHDK